MVVDLSFQNYFKFL